jgi:hypothetical protein
MAAKLFMAARQALQEYLLVFMLNIFLSSSALYKTKQNKMIEKYLNIMDAKLFMAVRQALQGYILVFKLNKFL